MGDAPGELGQPDAGILQRGVRSAVGAHVGPVDLAEQLFRFVGHPQGMQRQGEVDRTHGRGGYSPAVGHPPVDQQALGFRNAVFGVGAELPGVVARIARVGVPPHQVVAAADREPPAADPGGGSGAERGRGDLPARQARPSGGFLGQRPGGDADHPGEGVGPVQGGGRSADDLDALHFLQGNGLDLPGGPADQLQVGLAPVHQHQEEVVLEVPLQAGGDRGIEGRAQHHVHAGHVSQQVGNGGGARGLDVLAGDYGDGRRRLADVLLVLGGGVDRVQQLSQKKLVEVVEFLHLILGPQYGSAQEQTE